MTQPFLDVPVYRLGEAEYYRQRDEFAAKRIEPMLRAFGEEAADPKHKPMIDSARAHLIDVFGGCWRFNEIVGYIRLYFLGSQIRGEYFAVAKKRLVRSRTKRFDWRSHKLAGEVDIEHPITESSILTAIRKYLVRCQRELPRRTIDAEAFDVLAHHIRWRDLWEETNPFSHGFKRR